MLHVECSVKRAIFCMLQLFVKCPWSLDPAMLSCKAGTMILVINAVSNSFMVAVEGTAIDSTLNNSVSSTVLLTSKVHVHYIIADSSCWCHGNAGNTPFNRDPKYKTLNLDSWNCKYQIRSQKLFVWCMLNYNHVIRQKNIITCFSGTKKRFRRAGF